MNLWRFFFFSLFTSCVYELTCVVFWKDFITTALFLFCTLDMFCFAHVHDTF